MPMQSFTITIYCMLILQYGVFVYSANSENDGNKTVSNNSTNIELNGVSWVNMSNYDRKLYLSGYIDALENSAGFNKGIHSLFIESDEKNSDYYINKYENMIIRNTSGVMSELNMRNLLKSESVRSVVEFNKSLISRSDTDIIINKISSIYKNEKYLKVPLRHIVTISNSLIKKIYDDNMAQTLINIMLGNDINTNKVKPNGRNSGKVYTE